MGALSRFLFGRTIHVTQEDIDNGKKGVDTKCAIALAIQRVVTARYGLVQITRSSSRNCGEFIPKREVWVNGCGGYHVGFAIESTK